MVLDLEESGWGFPRRGELWHLGGTAKVLRVFFSSQSQHRKLISSPHWSSVHGVDAIHKTRVDAKPDVVT